VPAAPAHRGPSFVVRQAHPPRTWEAVALRCADPWTPRERVVVAGARQGDHEERRPLEGSTEGVSYLAHPARLDREAGAAGRLAGWPGRAQVCRLPRAVEWVSGAHAGTVREEWPAALTSRPPQRADAARLEQLWRGHWPIENGWHDGRAVTLGEDACPVRADRAPANRAAGRNAALTLLRPHGSANVAAALRRQAMSPREALALLGVQLACKDPGPSARV
jgi:hypothetical protein